jgi:O-antigen ligase
MMVLLLLIPFSDQILIGLSRSGRADELATGTSRTLIWQVVSMLAWQKPLLGWGYGSTVFLLPQYEHYMGHAAPHAHNIVLQLWITTGFVGVGLFLLAASTRFILALARGERTIVALLLFVILNGLTESSAFGGIANITSIALILAAVFRESTELNS